MTDQPPLQLPGFDGQLTDQATAWQFLGQGYRAYNPRLQRFMAEDSLSPFAKGGINGYVFANNNPIMLFDPSGHISTGLASLLMGIGVSFGVYGATIAGAYAGGSTALTWISRILFTVGSSAPAFYQAGTEFSQHKAMLGLSDVLVGVSGIFGTVSAQPGLMLGNVAAKTRDTAVLISSTLSQVTMGAAVGIKSDVANHTNQDQAAQTGLSVTNGIVFGFLGGIFYGQVSKKLFSSGTNILSQVGYGSIRTGITGLISSAPAIAHDLVNQKYNNGRFYMDYLVPFAMGAISGVTQQGYDRGLKGLEAVVAEKAGESAVLENSAKTGITPNYGTYARYGLARLSYLFVKNPLWGAFASGQFSSFFS